MSLLLLCSPFVRAVRRCAPVCQIPAGRALSFLLLLLATAPAMAQVPLTTLGTAYTQNFDTLPATGSATWTSNSTITGWYSVRSGTGTTIVADTGSSNGGNLYSFGSTGSSDRALGSLGSSNATAGNFFYGVRLQNNTGATITSLDVAYVGEQWRNSAAAAQTVAFSYLVGSPAVTGTLTEFQLAGTTVTNLDFTSPITAGTAGALDGNAAANRTAKSFTITGLSLPSGTEIMLRWSDPDQAGADHGLAIDDFSVTPHGAATLPNLSINDVSVNEGDAGTTAASFTVSLSAPAGAGGVTFDIATADATATAGSDYVAKSLTAQTIPAGSSTYTFDVDVIGDLVPEANETFQVNVTNVTGATVADGQGIGTIIDNDATHLSIADVTKNEGNAGSTTFAFTVSLSQPAPASGVSFDIATADGTATAPSDYTAQVLTGQMIPAGSTTYTFNVSVNGDTTPESDETFFVNISNVVNAMVDDGQAVGTIVNDDLNIAKIHDVQGSGSATPMPGATVTVEGVATAVFLGTGKLGGFFVQEEDADADADPNTSEGIFVFCPSCVAGSVVEGQRVRVAGVVNEFFNMTQLTPASAADVIVTDAGNHLAEVTPLQVSLPIVGDVDAYYEAREGMLITYTSTLAVSEYFELARYGQIELVGGDRPRQFTEDNAPSVSGYAAHLAELARRQVILDDDNNAQNSVLTQPSGSQALYWPHTNAGLSVGTQGIDYFRGGDQVQNLTGVLHWSFAGLTGTDAWRIRPTVARPVTFTVANPRPATPPNVGGSIRAVGMNLLNYFTTIDTTASSSSGPCGPSGGLDCRGADSVAELNRQRERASIVVCTLNPDVAAFMELENTTPSDTITDLLGAVNARCANGHPYTFANTGGTLGGDAIRVQIVYRTGILSTVGSPLVDLDAIHDRPPTAQTFDVSDASNPAFGQRFTVVANHFKSKGSCPTGGGADADQNDGQGCWAVKRNSQATRLMSWINSTVIPAANDPDVLLLGDFNAYASETAVTTLKSGGYADMETVLHGTNAYSYLFNGELGHLDYAFASSSLVSQVTGADAWHINADEVPAFDYNDEIKDVGEPAQDQKPNGSALTPPRTLWEQPVTPYRASDHDPVVVGLFGTSNLSVSITDTPDPVVAGGNITYTITVTNNGPDAANVTWLDLLPANTTLGDYFADPGWGCGATVSPPPQNVVCSNPSMAAGASAVFTLIVAVNAQVANGTIITNSVSLSTSNNDPDPTDNSATTTTTVTGTPQGHLTITPAAVNFGNQLVGTTSAATTVTLANDGSASLNVTALTAAAAPFARAGGTCATTLPITLAVGANCTLTYTFAPNATGAAAQTLTVTANAPGSGTIALSGTGVQGNLTITPATLAFGNQMVGSTSAPLAVTLANNGNASLNVTALTAAAAPFTRAGGTCAATLPITLAAGTNCTLGYTFAPSTSGAATQTLTVTANAPGSGTITLTGTGSSPQADVALSITDGREFVRVGETLNYVITVSNASGPAAATANVSDVLPPQLSNGAWSCVPTGAATCANGTGNTLSDNATLPVGTHVTYVYSATVQPGSTNEVFANSAAATVTGGVIDANPANNSASDTPANVIVIFKDGFDSAGVNGALDGFSDGAGFVSAQLLVNASLLDRLGIMPVIVASGETTDAGTAFTIELARFNAQTVMRLIVSTAHGQTERGEWRAVDLDAGALDFAWQSAASGKQDGYLRLAAGNVAVQSVDRSDTARLVRLRIAVGDERPWLTLAPE